jgi:site-specific recombinase XerD
MSSLAPTLEAFFTQRLAGQLNASPNTIASYRDAFKLLLGYVAATTGTPPYKLDFEDINAQVISGFLDDLETNRGASISTRNARLAAIHSLFRFASIRHPEHAQLISRVLDIPTKQTRHALITYLDRAEIDALLGAPDRATRIGRRDHALLLVAVQTGLRVSELIGLRRTDVALGTGAHLACTGKGRKQRATPLLPETVSTLKAWLHERPGQPGDPLFPGPRGRPLTRDAVAAIVARHATKAAETCPSIASKRVTAHVLRHSFAMDLYHQGVDPATIALYLGHEGLRTTSVYVTADTEIKQRALARITPIGVKPGRYRPTDKLLAFLEAL